MLLLLPTVVRPSCVVLFFFAYRRRFVQAKPKASSSVKTKQNTEAGSGARTPGLCPRVPGVGRGVMMGVYVQDLMRLDEGELQQ